MISLKTLEFGYNLWIQVKHNKRLHDSSNQWREKRAQPFTSPYWLTVHSHIGADFWNVNTGARWNECVHVTAPRRPPSSVQEPTLIQPQFAYNPTRWFEENYRLTDCWRQMTRLIELMAKTHLCCVKRDKNQRQPGTRHTHQVSRFSFLLSYGRKRALDRDLYWPVSDSY